MATRRPVMDETQQVVVHRLTGTEKEVLEKYHHDVDRMGWAGYVEVSHTLTGIPRGWKALFLEAQKEMLVTYRRLD
ncbi:MAG TPA: hypothetical protein VFB58_09430 [Chloroflexota bacterium]|nr:hypothetical protein [Chloroflexota bacterium]